MEKIWMKIRKLVHELELEVLGTHLFLLIIKIKWETVQIPGMSTHMIVT